MLVEQLLRLQSQELGAPAGVGVVIELDGTRDRLDPLVVEVADEAVEAAGVGERCGSSELGVGERRRDRRGVQQRRAVRRIAGQLLCLAEADQGATALRVLSRAQQVERVGKQLRGLRRGKAVECMPPGTRRIVSGLRAVDRRQAPVQRQLRDVFARVLPVELLERKRDPVVHARSPSRTQLRVQRLVDQRMHKAEAAELLGRLVQE